MSNSRARIAAAVKTLDPTASEPEAPPLGKTGSAKQKPEPKPENAEDVSALEAELNAAAAEAEEEGGEAEESGEEGEGAGGTPEPEAAPGSAEEDDGTPEPEAEEAPAAEVDPLAEAEQGEDPEGLKAQLEEAMDQLAQQRARNKALVQENKSIKENGLDALKVDPKLWDAKQKAEELQAENEALKEQLAAAPNCPPAIQEGSQWKGKEVRILLPWGKVTNPGTVCSVTCFGMVYGREKMGIIPWFGDSMIYNIRNRLADLFLETGAEWSFWLDDDVVVPWGAPQMLRDFCGLTAVQAPDSVFGVNGLERLISHKQKLVGGVYFGRRPTGGPMFGAGLQEPQAYKAAHDHDGRLIPTDWVATGALLVHRDVYLDIRKKFPELAPKTAGNPTEHWQYFAPEIGKGEDVMFGLRAKAAGHQSYADTGTQCLHIGTMPFGYWNTKFGPMEAANMGGMTFPGR